MNDLRYSALDPFGLVVHAPDHADLRTIPPATLEEWCGQARIVVLRGFPLLSPDELVAYVQSWGEPLLWDFGAVLDLVVQDDPKHHLFGRGPVPYHFDGAFAAAVPSFFMFQCQRSPAEGAGGETVFCDTTRVLQAAGTDRKQRWQDVRITYRTEKVAYYGGEVTWDLLATHPKTGQPVLRYAEPLDPEDFPEPLSLEVHGLANAAQEDFLAELHAWLHRPEFCYPHTWRDGDIVLADNHALIHGRRRFVGDASRWLQRIQIL